MEYLRENFKKITFDAFAAAAFITPGTIISCGISGASYGYTMLWAIFLSVLITGLMQEMHLRLGLVTGRGLAENIRKMVENRLLGGIIILSVFLVTFGSAVAYIAGNIAALQFSLSYFFPKMDVLLFIIICAIVLLFVVSFGLNEKIEMLIIIMLAVLSLIFVLCAFLSKPNPLYVLKGLLLPQFGDGENAWLGGDENAWHCIISLIGTTILPYQLFLSASSARERWSKVEELTTARLNVISTIGLSGVVAVCITICGTAAFYGTGKTLQGIAGFSRLIELLIGDSTISVFCIALAFSGMVSILLIAINLTRFFEGAFHRRPIRWKIYYLCMSYGAIICSSLIAFMGSKVPIETLLMMQIGNVVLLPACVILLIFVMNHRSLQQFRNSPFENLLLVILLALTSVLCYQAVLIIFSRFDGILIRLANIFTIQ